MNPNILVVALALLGSTVLVLLYDLYLTKRRTVMSQSPQLVQALTDLTTAVNALAAKFANVTPDADVAQAVTQIQGITSQLSQLGQ